MEKNVITKKSHLVLPDFLKNLRNKFIPLTTAAMIATAIAGGCKMEAPEPIHAEPCEGLYRCGDRTGISRSFINGLVSSYCSKAGCDGFARHDHQQEAMNVSYNRTIIKVWENRLGGKHYGYTGDEWFAYKYDKMYDKNDKMFFPCHSYADVLEAESAAIKKIKELHPTISDQSTLEK